MTTVRPRTLLAVAAIVLAAGGVATAVATYGSPAPSGPTLVVNEAVITAYDLFPTSPANPDPHHVAEGVLDLAEFDDEHSKPEAPVRLTAACTNCLPGSEQQEQFEALVIEVHGHGGGKLYEGPLSDLDAEVVKAKKTVVKVWLADTGKPQPQGIVTEFSFTATSGSAQ